MIDIKDEIKDYHDVFGRDSIMEEELAKIKYLILGIGFMKQETRKIINRLE